MNTTVESPKRVVIYTRISRDDTGEGAANERQRQDCETLAALRRWTVVGYEEDISISAYSGKFRPGWNAVVERMKSGSVDIVAAYHIDRITRTVRELTEIIALGQAHGVGIATVNGDIDLTNDTGKMVATILSAVAEQEVERKGARQRRANQQRAADGHPWKSGWRAFGFTLDGQQVPEEAALIREAADLVLDGAPLRSIVKRWKGLGVTTPRSSKGVDGWTHNGVRSILLNPRNAGIATYKGEQIGKGNWEPIFSEETHMLLVAKLTNPSRLTRPVSRGRTASNLLTGIATCGTCGETVQGGTGHKGGLIYQCKNYHVSTLREEADAIVRDAFAASVALTRPGLLMPIRKPTSPRDLWEEAERLRNRLNDASTSYANERITLEQLETVSTSLRKKLEAVETQAAEVAGGEDDLFALRAESVNKFLDLNMEGQRAILSRLAVIVLYPKGRGRRNVPIDQQVTVHLRVTRKASSGRFIPEDKNDGSHLVDSEYLLPALNERTA